MVIDYFEEGVVYGQAPLEGSVKNRNRNLKG